MISYSYSENELLVGKPRKLAELAGRFLLNINSFPWKKLPFLADTIF